MLYELILNKLKVMIWWLNEKEKAYFLSVHKVQKVRKVPHLRYERCERCLGAKGTLWYQRTYLVRCEVRWRTFRTTFAPFARCERYGKRCGTSHTYRTSKVRKVRDEIFFAPRTCTGTGTCAKGTVSATSAFRCVLYR